MNEENLKNQRPVSFVIREPNGQLVGAAGYDGILIGNDHTAELGYWLAQEFWGKGLMTRVVKTLIRLGFEELGLEQLTAHVFTHNLKSQKVLEKCGFDRIELFEDWMTKDGVSLDGILFALKKSDWVSPSHSHTVAPAFLSLKGKD